MNLHDIETEMRKVVCQYKKAAASLATTGYYIRGRSGSPAEGRKYYCDVYAIINGEIKMVCHNTSPHRARNVILMLKGGTYFTIDPNIMQNYVTNGYSTRCGIRKANLKRIQEIAFSHAEYMGSETGSSTADHYNRVALRTKPHKS